MNKLNKLVATLLITAMLLGMTPTLFATSPAPVIWVAPTAVNKNTASDNVGDKFNVTVWIDSGPNMVYTWQVKVLFNPSQIKADRADYTGILPVGKSVFFASHSTIPVSPVIDNSTGFVVLGESLIGADPGQSGIGSLYWIEFEIMSAPGIGGNLTSLIDTNAGSDTFALDPTLTPITFAKDASVYLFTWSAPPMPNLAVDPTLLVFNQYSLWNLTTFTVDEKITSLNSGWFLGNASTELSYNSTLLAVDSVAFNPLWTGANTYTNNTGNLLLFVDAPSSNPSGNVTIATVTFRILYQGSVPTDPTGYHSDTPLTLHNYALASVTFNLAIPVNTVTNGLVKIFSYQALVAPDLVVSCPTLGPGPVLGQLFNVTVSIQNLNVNWNLVGIQFRLQYNAALIQPVSTTEGPFMPYWSTQEPGSLGTFYISFFDTSPDNVVVGNMVYPNATGSWNPVLPNGNGTIAIITFQVMFQSFGEPDITSPLHLYDVLGIGIDNFVSQNIIVIPVNTIDCDYTITTTLPGRSLDVYGYAVNSGYGPKDWQQILQFPPPYGGQGPNAPMDLVEPQSQIFLHANVTYNYWPVQHKLVAFEIDQPDGTPYVNLFAFTDSNGVATVDFRMPWPCDNPESLFGVWKVTSTVQLADIIINDTMLYHYDYMVHIWKVTTDKYEYNHGETVYVTITYGSHAQQYYSALIKARISDELGVVIGEVRINTTIGGTVFCQYKNWTVTVPIPIPKWAYAGIATVHVNVFDKEPIVGGVPLGPEFTPPPTIAIQPY